MEAQLIDKTIEEYMPFIVKTISSFTGRYVSIENDEELSIGLMAFNEALEKYKEDRGSFISFAELVIKSRLKNFYQKENKHNKVISLDKLREDGTDIRDHNKREDQEELKREIGVLGSNLNSFGLSFEDLVNEAPKHEDTRKNAIEVSKKINKEKNLVELMFEKKRLPVKKVSIKLNVTEKIIKRSKKFIISVVIIFFKNLRNLKLWIEG